MTSKERRKTQVVTFRGREGVPLRVVDVIAWLNARLSEVPEEFRESAELNIPESLVSVSYARPETDEEHAKRKSDAKRGHAMGLAGEPSPGPDNWDLWNGWYSGNEKRLEMDGGRT